MTGISASLASHAAEQVAHGSATGADVEGCLEAAAIEAGSTRPEGVRDRAAEARGER